MTASVISTMAIEDVGLEVRLIEVSNGTFNVILFDVDAKDVVGGRCGYSDRSNAEAYAASLFASNS